MEGAVGIEPTTRGLKARCSTAELSARCSERYSFGSCAATRTPISRTKVWRLTVRRRTNARLLVVLGGHLVAVLTIGFPAVDADGTGGVFGGSPPPLIGVLSTGPTVGDRNVIAPIGQRNTGKLMFLPRFARAPVPKAPRQPPGLFAEYPISGPPTAPTR